MSVLKIVRSWVGFSRKEANGFLIIILLTGVYISVPWFFKKYSASDKASDKDSLLLKAWTMKLEQDEVQKRSPDRVTAPVYFDPNTATKAELIKAGVPDWLSARIINYREKVGRYDDKKELLKVYGFSDKLYLKLSPYIQITKVAEKSYAPKENKLVLHDLNLVTASELQKIKGIGPVLSERIIKFRNKLGGFVSEDQVKEVYGLDSTVISALLDLVFVKEDYVPEKININYADEKIMAAHPYIRKYKAKGILFKRTNTPIADIDQLKELKVFTEDELIKVSPYLTF